MSLQIEQLLKLKRLCDIKERLGKLPKNLKEAYDEIFANIKSQEGSASVIAERAFWWIMSSHGPLNSSVLVAAVCQDPEEHHLQDVDINIDYILEVCGNLLILDRNLCSSQDDSVCNFVHLSVREYFETCWTKSQSHGLVATVCLSLLNVSEHQVNQAQGI